MSKQTYSIDVTVRVVIKAKSESKAEELFDKKLFAQFPDAEYYNLQSREGSWSALYVGDGTDNTDVWRPSIVLHGKKHYFSPDGNYGSANDLAVIDTTNWTDKDWERVEECNDNDRLDIARIIDDFRTEKW